MSPKISKITQQKPREVFPFFLYTNYSINCFVFYYYLLLLLLYLITCYSPQWVKILIFAPLIQNHVFRLLKVLLKPELRQINCPFKVPNNCAHYTSLVYQSFKVILQLMLCREAYDQSSFIVDSHYITLHTSDDACLPNVGRLPINKTSQIEKTEHCRRNSLSQWYNQKFIHTHTNITIFRRELAYIIEKINQIPQDSQTTTPLNRPTHPPTNWAISMLLFGWLFAFTAFGLGRCHLGDS